MDPLNVKACNPEKANLVLSASMAEQMRRHVIDSAPFEACGLVAGQECQALVVIPITNQLHSPVRFRMEPREQLAAFELIEAQGWELLAIYHSHPKGPPSLSPTDISEAYYPDVLHLIWYCQEDAWEVKAFAICQEQATGIPLLLT